MAPLSIPSPEQGVWHLGPVPLRAYALCIIAGIVVAVWIGERRWVARGGRAGDVTEVATWMVPFGILGGRIYHVLTTPEPYFGDGGRAAARPVHLGGRPRHLGRHRPRRGRRLDRLPAPRHPAAAVRRRPRAGHRRRAGDRPVRQLLQPGALRPADRPAVGARDRPGAPARRLRRTARPTTRRSSTRRSGTSASPALVDLGRPPVQARARPGVRALRRGLHRRPGLDRGAAHRRRQRHPRAAAQRLDLHPGVHRRGRPTSSCRPGGDPGREESVLRRRRARSRRGRRRRARRATEPPSDEEVRA